MFSLSQYIPFCLRVLHQILAQNLLFVENFHCVKLPLWRNHICDWVHFKFFNKVNDAKASLSNLHYSFEVFWPNKCLLLASCLRLLPDLDELTFPLALLLA
jgi:hypothetical protein